MVMKRAGLLKATPLLVTLGDGDATSCPYFIAKFRGKGETIFMLPLQRVASEDVIDIGDGVAYAPERYIAFDVDGMCLPTTSQMAIKRIVEDIATKSEQNPEAIVEMDLSQLAYKRSPNVKFCVETICPVPALQQKISLVGAIASSSKDASKKKGADDTFSLPFGLSLKLGQADKTDKVTGGIGKTLFPKDSTEGKPEGDDDGSDASESLEAKYLEERDAEDDRTASGGSDANSDVEEVAFKDSPHFLVYIFF
jgi:hypothetical protein